MAVSEDFPYSLNIFTDIAIHANLWRDLVTTYCVTAKIQYKSNIVHP